MVALKYEESNWNPGRVSNIKPFEIKYKWEGINYPSKIDDWKTSEKNNPKTAFNILYIKKKDKLYVKIICQKIICPDCISKINSNCEIQIILLIISNKGKK